MLRKLTWSQLTRGGVPPLFVLRPLGKLTPPNVGDEYPAPDPADKVQMTRTRQMYEQRHISTKEHIDLILSKRKIQEKAPAKPGKGKKNGGTN